ncbi:MAG: hypothetical protein ACLGHA_11520 [Gammaproteobacteria bacterium]
MRIRTFLAMLACVAASLVLTPAFADPAAPTPAPAAAALQPCPADAQGLKVAQLSCCKANKGVCGCRAGKIVCCDNTTSTEPGCTCRGDDGVIE